MFPMSTSSCRTREHPGSGEVSRVTREPCERRNQVLISPIPGRIKPVILGGGRSVPVRSAFGHVRLSRFGSRRHARGVCAAGIGPGLRAVPLVVPGTVGAPGPVPAAGVARMAAAIARICAAAAIPAPAPVAGRAGAGMYAAIEDEPFPIPAIQLSDVDPAFLRKNVAYFSPEPAGTIVIDPANHFLYLIQGGGKAVRYGVGVGRQGFSWSGSATIHDKQEWPDWYPPREMLARQPELMRHMSQLRSGIGMPGGPRNPLAPAR